MSMNLVDETELRKLQEAISAADAHAAQLRVKADELATSAKGELGGAEALLDPKHQEAFEKIDASYREADDAHQGAINLRTKYTRILEMSGMARGPESPATPEAVRRSVAVTAGRRYVDSETFGALKNVPQAIIRNAFLAAPAVEVMTREEAEETRFRAITGAGTLVVPDRDTALVDLPARRPRVADLVSIGSTDSDTIEYVEKTARTDAAAGTAYGTLLPEHAFTMVKRTVNVRRIGVWVPATQGNLSDAGQLRGIIDDELTGDFRRKLDDQMANGDGAGENFTGILNASGIGSQARGVDTHLDAVHKAITVVRLAYFDEPTAILIHPNDYEDVVLAKDSAGNYLFRIGEPTTLWGLVAVVNSVIAAGTSLVGEFSRANLYLREGVSVAASSEHSTFFLSGEVAIKAEGRMGFATKQPKAFCKVTGM